MRQLEGRRPIIEALRAGTPLDEIVIAAGSKPSGALAEIVRLAQRRGVAIREVPRKEIESRMRSRNAQGVIATSSTSESTYVKLEGLIASAKASGSPALFVALDGVTDPQNLGAIARSAEAAGAHGLIVPRRRSAPVTAAAEKASAGALEHLAVAQVANLARALEELKEEGIWIVALDGDATTSIYDVAAEDPLCLVIGSEGSGVSRLIAERADHRVSIPMHGKIESLNASAAAAVALFDIARRRA